MQGFLPRDLTDPVLVPIVKDKTGDVTREMKSICIHMIISLGLNQNTLHIYVFMFIP